jgi:hypothetical protein
MHVSGILGCDNNLRLRRLRQEDHKFKGSLNYIMRPCGKKERERDRRQTDRKEGRNEEGRKEGRKEMHSS